MRIFKTRQFARWARKRNLADSALVSAVAEMQMGLVDAALGGHVFKERVPFASKGKRGGFRTLVAFQSGRECFFVYGFAKNDRSTISRQEIDALKLLARELFSYRAPGIRKALAAGAIIEVMEVD